MTLDLIAPPLNISRRGETRRRLPFVRLLFNDGNRALSKRARDYGLFNSICYARHKLRRISHKLLPIWPRSAARTLAHFRPDADVRASAQ